MSEPGDDADLTGGGLTLFHLVQFWSRRWVTRAAEDISGSERIMQDLIVLGAVDVASRRNAEVAVADVAHQLGLDPSSASRSVSATVEHGYLERGTSAEDSRRAVLTITPAGRELLASSHAWQDEMFAKLVADWDPADAVRLANYLRRLAGTSSIPSVRRSIAVVPRKRAG